MRVSNRFPSVCGGGVIITDATDGPSGVVCPLTTKKFFADEATMKKKEKDHSSSDGFETAADDEIEEAAALEDCNGPQNSFRAHNIIVVKFQLALTSDQLDK